MLECSKNLILRVTAVWNSILTQFQTAVSRKLKSSEHFTIHENRFILGVSLMVENMRAKKHPVAIQNLHIINQSLYIVNVIIFI